VTEIYAALKDTIERPKRREFMIPKCTAALIVAIAIVPAIPASGQWANVRTSNIPRMPDGKPNLAAPAPRTADGKPELSGVWMVSQTFVDGVPKYAGNLAADLKPDDAPKLQPSAEALLKHRMETLGKDFPPSRCLPPGVPLIQAIPVPFKIVQVPGMVVILYEAWTIYRQIFTDGRGLPKDPNPTWMGYSVGNWNGDTLVVETAGLNDRSWLDMMGHPHTEALHVIERCRRSDFGRMEIQITIDDPGGYLKPWTVTESSRLLPDTELLEFICNENEKDLPHLVGR
jgi:hypothetical protein